MSILLLAVITLSVVLLYKAIYAPLQYWKNYEVPHDKPLPIIGNVTDFILHKKALGQVQKELYDKYSNHRYCGFFMFTSPSLFVRDPELIKQICVKDFNAFCDHRVLLPEKADPFWNKVIFARKGQDWRDLRKIISPAFSQSKMKHMFVYLNECSKRLLKSIPDTKSTLSMDMKDTFSKFSCDITVNAAFGIECDSYKEPNNIYYEMGKNTFITSSFRALKFFGASISTKLATFFKISFFDENLKLFYRTVIKETLEYRKRNNIVRIDVLNLLTEAQNGRLKYEQGDKGIKNIEFSIPEEDSVESTNTYTKDISDDDILVQIMAMFFTSFESVTSYMSNTAYELALNPDVQNRLIEEVDNAWKKCDGNITYELIVKMKYFDMVCSEVIRLRSPVVQLNRIATRPYTIPPVLPHEKPLHLKLGQDVTIPIYCLLMDPNYYPNPENFDPERFSDENKHNINPSTFLPFGYGPRACMGPRLGLLQVKLIIFYFLLKFRFVPIEKTGIPFTLHKMSVSQDNEKGYWLGLEPRQDIL